MLSVTNLTVRQGGTELWQALSLTVAPGERLGISAPSGAGKTTLGRVLAGWQRANEGQIQINGKPLPHAGYCPVQLVPQHPELTFNPWRSAGAGLRDAWEPDIDMLAALHVDPRWLARKPSQLSGGELARIALLRALDPRTQYLIADEVTAQLDPVIQRDIWAFLLQRCQRQAMGMIIFSHQAALLQQICTEIRFFGDRSR